MGHTRLGSIPKGQKWTGIVERITGSPDAATSPGISQLPDLIAEVANTTLEAANQGLRRATDDLGLRYTFYLLTQVVLASRSKDWESDLQKHGIRLGESATIFDLTAEIQAAIDNFLLSQGHSTDVGEMAQRAAGEAVSSLAGPKSVTLFGAGREELQSAVRSLSTKDGFGLLGQRFFARFIGNFLNFYLSRVTAAHLGGYQLQQVGDVSEFNNALSEHCEQSARIVRDFCAGWYSKTQFESGIDLQNTSRFIAVALDKLRGEFQLQRKEQ